MDQSSSLVVDGVGSIPALCITCSALLDLPFLYLKYLYWENGKWFNTIKYLFSHILRRQKQCLAFSKQRQQLPFQGRR